MSLDHGPQLPPDDDIDARTSVEMEREKHLSDFLARVEQIDLLLQRQLRVQQQRFDAGAHEMQGLVITPEEIEAQLRQPIGLPRWANAKPQSVAQGVDLPIAAASRLGLLKSRFALQPIDIDLLLFALLPHLDPRYTLIFAFMQDDVKRRMPSIDLTLNVFSANLEEKLALQMRLIDTAPLVRDGLLTVSRAEDEYLGQWNQRSLLVDEALFHYLIGYNNLPPAIAHLCRVQTNVEAVAGQDHPVISQIQAAVFTPDVNGHLPVVALSGKLTSGRAAALAEACRRQRRTVLEVDLEPLAAKRKTGEELERLQRDADYLILILREAILQDACLLLRGLEDIAEHRQPLLVKLAERLAEGRIPVAYLSNTDLPVIPMKGCVQQMIELPPRSLGQAIALLESTLGSGMPSGFDSAGVARRFNLQPETITTSIAEAKLWGRRRAVAASTDLAEDLSRVLALRARQNFGKLASRVTPTRTRADLVLTDLLDAQLDEIRMAVAHRDEVLDRGFRGKLGYGFGVSALFHGASGTGKTMAAEVLANELGVDLIRVDLSTVVNKYIGETEKHLSRIFDLAEADAGVLFFDEADALFGKRTEVKDSHDRHANIEVAYLLQRLENYPGLVVLSTNNRGHLDDAFTRRLTFIVRFQHPDAALRAIMWRNIWPQGVVTADSVDFEDLAHRFEITGANIRNIALLASWLAADAGTPVQLTHIERAAARELAKIGQIVLK